MPISFKKQASLGADVQSVVMPLTGLTVIDALRELLSFQEQCHKEGHVFLRHPLLKETIEKIKTVQHMYYLEPCRGLNNLFQHADLLQKIHYIDIIGITIALDRHSAFRDAVRYRKFCDALAVRGIINPSWLMDDHAVFKENIRRIHVLQDDFLDDPEISQGLHISYSKNTADNKVLYVSSEELLGLAVKHCAPGVTLIIDGHWEHKKRSMHGVWENADAMTIAASLQALSREYPYKIYSIRLWGCASGQLADYDTLSTMLHVDNLLFKDECVPFFANRDMAPWRNRGVYYAHSEESPFDEESLAGRIMQSVPSYIRITGVPSYGYPFPVQPKPLYNIGSDADTWRGEHYWKNMQEHTPWYTKLSCLKSITVIRDGADVEKKWPPKIDISDTVYTEHQAGDSELSLALSGSSLFCSASSLAEEIIGSVTTNDEKSVSSAFR